MMNWDDLRLFQTIASSSSFTVAAGKLGINQSTVSRRLASMEKNLGVRLIHRRAGLMSLTVAGEDILRRVEKIADEISFLQETIEGRDHDMSGRLLVTCPDSFLHFYLIDHLPQFLETYPEIELELATDYQYRSLAKREADVSIRVTSSPPETLIGRKLFSVNRAVYAAPSLLAKLDEQREPKDLTWIGWTHEPYNRLMVTNLFPDAIVQHRCNSQMDIVAMVKQGLGVGVMGCFIGDKDTDLERVYDDVIPNGALDLWVLWHPDMRHVAKVKAFSRFVSEIFLKDESLFKGNRHE